MEALSLSQSAFRPFPPRVKADQAVMDGKVTPPKAVVTAAVGGGYTVHARVAETQ